jgi:putative hemolysin
LPEIVVEFLKMARWLLDCYPLCGYRWRLGVATESEEKEEAYRLRYNVFFREQGYGRADWISADGRDVDSFDSWCEHLILRDEERQKIIGTYRAIPGVEAMRRGGFYGSAEFDLKPLEPIAPRILQGSRTCVAAGYRGGLAIRYLSYGMELLLREHQCHYFLGADSFRADDADTLNRIFSYVRQYGSDSECQVQPLPANQVAALRVVPVTADDEALLPSVIRTDLRLGFRSCGPPAWDPDFCCYDFLVLGRRDRMTRLYTSFVERIERQMPSPTG